MVNKRPAARIVSMATAGVIAVITGSLVACSATPQPSATDSTSTDSPAQVTISQTPIADAAPVYLGLEEGIFQEHGIELSVEPSGGAAADAPLLQSGQIQFATMNLISIAQAREAGIDITIAAPASWSTGEDDDFVAVYAKPDSGIRSAADLEGKTVATNTLAGVGPTVIRNSVKAHGGDPAKVVFVEVEFPQMISVLEAGQVDAIWLAEPFITMAKEAGFVPVASPFKDIDSESFPTAFLVTTTEFAQSNPELFSTFTDAYREAVAFAAANEDKVRANLLTFTSLSPDLAQAITLPKFAPPTFSLDQLQPMADVIYADGLVSEPLNLDELIIAP